MSDECFPMLIFENEGQKTEFQKYIKLKGRYLYLQIYNLLLERNVEGVRYYEVSSFIRYDKNLRFLVYTYLATLEEWLRAQLLEMYDVVDGKGEYKQHCYKKLQNDLVPKKDKIKSELYWKFQPDFSDLMQICDEKKVSSIEEGRNALKELRNKTMHHAFILFGNTEKCGGLRSYFEAVQKKLNILLNALPQEYREGFLSDIKKLNGENGRKYLEYWYLEVIDGKICIKE